MSRVADSLIDNIFKPQNLRQRDCQNHLVWWFSNFFEAAESFGPMEPKALG